MRKDYSDIIIRPIISEKSMNLRAEREYVFEVDKNANKKEIKEAVEKLFNVKVERVNTLIVKPKPKRDLRRGYMAREGHTKEWKKAIVKLAEGYTIKELQA
ncbi:MULTISPECIES: 50S ribosomal protein L23 [Fervidobacterium]|jgi:large subunit ribosomal protein L23|uniref:Large ribosomal subunit protein uL23 n=3 Tax=Fervidobacterium pennivorans TaxID=93466 RepID=A0A172T0U7_FERPE|nr:MULTISPECIES: 50S ribosomal protein L23 [Fervidobacterium]AFG35488.1 ribosomal protein L23 [Fervidobacterium pennivorans DSM 9078]ANE40621.1 50S ribosomal protein L23 [Fervidobacterium pennivorans]MDM7320334.1 50S ribosomal protein L23 [Fervidobacterium sp.]NPU88691.1 50S ribosomal protein L23 [Fervidobacterium sp.]QIV78875.1 50S ribosomal protein L23 [Fervidobacterium pennivorans subsp. keratinolyticus]